MNYERFFEGYPDAIAVLDREGQLLSANAAAQALLELPVSARSGAPVTVDLAKLGIGNGDFEELCRKAVDGEAPAWEFESPSAGGELLVSLQARLSCLADDVTGADTYLWIGHDITDRVDLERRRQDFVYMIVHDLRVPLGNILNSLDLVLTAWREQDLTIPVEQILLIGLRSTRKMELLVSDILDVARLQSNQRTLAVGEIDVQSMVREAVDTVTPTANRHSQTIGVDMPPDLPTMEGDSDLLTRILVNLLSNAVKYVQDGGKIAVNVQADDEVFRFGVIDNGPGIPPESQDNVFQLFSRGQSKRASGAGIGLAFCKLAVNAHGGRIWVESELGAGCSFYFTIPRALPADAVYAADYYGNRGLEA